MNSRLAQKLRNNTGLVNCILAVESAASALFTYEGASIGAVDFHDKAQALVLAVAGGAAIYLFWSEVMKAALRLETRKDKAMLMAIIAVGCLFIFRMSSAYNVTGLVGEDALDKHVSVYVNATEEAVDGTFRRSMLIDGVYADLQSEVTRYEAAIGSEFHYGAYSANPGPGAVTTALTGIKGRLETSRKSASDFIAQRDELEASARARLETIRKIAASERPYEARSRDIAREADALRADLARMDPAVMADSLARMVEALPQETNLQSGVSRNPEVARRQIAALDKVRADIRTTGGKMRAFIEEATSDAPPRVAPLEKISAVKAVTDHWENYASYWASGIALDIAPLSVVLILMLVVGSQSREEWIMENILRTSIADLASAHLAEKALRSLGVDPETLRSFGAFLLGRRKKKDEGEEE